jgi:hypothetical protein
MAFFFPPFVSAACCLLFVILFGFLLWLLFLKLWCFLFCVYSSFSIAKLPFLSSFHHTVALTVSFIRADDMHPSNGADRCCHVVLSLTSTPVACFRQASSTIVYGVDASYWRKPTMPPTAGGKHRLFFRLVVPVGSSCPTTSSFYLHPLFLLLTFLEQRERTRIESQYQ